MLLAALRDGECSTTFSPKCEGLGEPGKPCEVGLPLPLKSYCHIGNNHTLQCLEQKEMNLSVIMVLCQCLLPEDLNQLCTYPLIKPYFALPGR